MRRQRTLVLAEFNGGDKRTFRVKSLVNSIDFTIGQSLGPVAVDKLISCPSWTVKIVAAVVEP